MGSQNVIKALETFPGSNQYKTVKQQDIKAMTAGGTNTGGNVGSVNVAVLQHKHVELKAVQGAWENINILVNKIKEQYDNDEFMFDLPNEKASTREKRKKHFKKGFQNYTQRLISTKAEYIYRKEVRRDFTDKVLNEFILKADNDGQSLTEFMKNQALITFASYGTTFCVVDKPRNQYNNLKAEMESGICYLNVLEPLAVLDFQYDRNGQLMWFRYKVGSDTTRDAFSSPEKRTDNYITWDRMAWYKHDKNGKLIDTFNHNLGIVPVAIQSDFVANSSKTIGGSTFFDSSDYIIMGNNLLNIGNNEMFKFGASLLVGAIQDFNNSRVSLDKDDENQLDKLTKEFAEHSDMILVDDVSKNMPQYLTKDLDAIDKSIELAYKYFDLAIENEKSRRAVTQNVTQAQSGVAKAYDADEEGAMLASMAQNMEFLETQILDIVKTWHGIKEDSKPQYERAFDVRSFNEKMNEIKSMLGIDFPSEVAKKELYKSIIADITNDQSKIKEISAEVDAHDFEAAEEKKIEQQQQLFEKKPNTKEKE